MSILIAARDVDASLRRGLGDAVWRLIGQHRTKAAPPQLDALATPPGATLYAIDPVLYCVDRHASNVRLDDTDIEDCGEFEAAVFDRIAIELDKPEGGGARDDGFGCWNCGQRGHSVRDCPEPYDADRVNEARKRFNAATGDANAGAKSDETAAAEAEQLAKANPHVMPGRLSAELREALGIARGEPPPWLRRMRRHGYPPGYLGPVPHQDSERHWGYAGNGELSTLVSQHDSGYAAVWPHSVAWSAREREAAATRAVQQAVSMFGHEHDEGAAASSEGAPAAAGASAATTSDAPVSAVTPAVASQLRGLFDAPAAAGLRLTPFLPACVCGRTLTAAIPGINVEYDPAVHDTNGDAAAAAAGEADAPPAAKRQRTDGAQAVYKWPRPIAEPTYCPVHHSTIVRPILVPGSGGGAAATAAAPASVEPSSAAASAPLPAGDGDGGGSESGDDIEGAPRAGAKRRLSRYLAPRDREALEAAVRAAAGRGWYAHIGGTSELNVANAVISDGVKGRGASGDDEEEDRDSTAAGAAS